MRCLLIENPKQEYVYTAWIQLVIEFQLSIDYKELIKFVYSQHKSKALVCLVNVNQK